MIQFNGTSLNMDSKPTPDEVYEAALMVRNIAKISDVLPSTEMTNIEVQSTMYALTKILHACGEILSFSLDRCLGKENWKDVTWDT